MCTGEVCALRKNIIYLLVCNEKLGALGNVMIMDELCELTWKFVPTYVYLDGILTDLGALGKCVH